MQRFFCTLQKPVFLTFQKYTMFKHHIRLIFFIILALGSFTKRALAQDSLVAYQRGFQFNPGVYLNFQAFQTNDPIPVENIQSLHEEPSDIDFLKKVTSRRHLEYLDDEGNLQKVATRNLFGYSNGRNVYILPDIRLSIIGTICHFTVFIPRGNTTYLDSWGNFGVISGDPESSYQYVLDMDSTRLLPFNKTNMENIFQRDQELWEEYKAFKRKKKEKLYLFLTKYNERHPVYFPASN